uniref:Uncharacterized protein n=1 Tax=Myoviridae sp. ctA4D8 TaxID=2823535 RepID=A0A8S5L6N6_9CAUD|nr:MAG TPA: hypothetical protein [Myoviridae sp. ctA4D8]
MLTTSAVSTVEHAMIYDPYFYLFFVGGLLFSILSDYDDPVRKKNLTFKSIVTSIVITSIVSFLSMFAYSEGYVNKFVLYLIITIMSVFGHAIIIKYRTPLIDSSGKELTKLPKTASKFINRRLGVEDTPDPTVENKQQSEEVSNNP